MQIRMKLKYHFQQSIGKHPVIWQTLRWGGCGTEAALYTAAGSADRYSSYWGAFGRIQQNYTCIVTLHLVIPLLRDYPLRQGGKNTVRYMYKAIDYSAFL